MALLNVDKKFNMKLFDFNKYIYTCMYKLHNVDTGHSISHECQIGCCALDFWVNPHICLIGCVTFMDFPLRNKNANDLLYNTIMNNYFLL